MSGSVVASPRFEPANLSRTESGEERLALHKNHEGRAQAVRAMRGYGTTAHGAKRPFAVWDEPASEGLPWPVEATHLQHDELKLLILLS